MLEVKSLPLDVAIEKLNGVFESRREILKLEMINCTEAAPEFRFRGRAVKKSIELNVHGCVLTFRMLKDIVLEVCHKNTVINLSGNMFKRCENDRVYLDDLERISEKNWHSDVKALDLTNCNFSDEEKNLLRTKLGSCPLQL